MNFFLVTMFLAILDYPSSDTWCVRALKLKFHAGFPNNISSLTLQYRHFARLVVKFLIAAFAYAENR